jgi:hypothetical protein
MENGIAESRRLYNYGLQVAELYQVAAYCTVKSKIAGK